MAVENALFHLSYIDEKVDEQGPYVPECKGPLKFPCPRFKPRWI